MPKWIEEYETGVYGIRNRVNGKVYVGSASKGFESRWTKHKSALNKGKHRSKHLQAAWNKYGEVSFVFEVLERCTPNECIKTEQRWIDATRCYESAVGYNTAKIAGSVRGMKHSADAKSRDSEAVKKKMSSANTRAQLSKKQRENWKDPQYRANHLMKRLGVKVSVSTRDKMSRHNTDRWADPKKREAQRTKMLQWWAKRKAETQQRTAVQEET